MPPPIKPQPEPDDDLHVADMDIDSQIMSNKKEKKEKKKKFIRMAAGTTWEDPSLGEWDPGILLYMCLYYFQSLPVFMPVYYTNCINIGKFAY
jgi:hypothetical protein